MPVEGGPSEPGPEDQPTGGNGGNHGGGLPPRWEDLLVVLTPSQAAQIRQIYNTQGQAGYAAAKILYNNFIEQSNDTGGSGGGSGGFVQQEFDPWDTGISNAYYQIWGVEIPESEKNYAKKSGMNVYEFIDYQRQKTSFKKTEVYHNESLARVGQLLDAFGFGGGFGGSPYPVSGTGTI